jgi:hypothetical protein
MLHGAKLLTLIFPRNKAFRCSQGQRIKMTISAAQWGEWPVSLDKTRKTKVKISMFFVHSLIDKTLLHLYQKNLVQNIVYLVP